MLNGVATVAKSPSYSVYAISNWKILFVFGQRFGGYISVPFAVFDSSSWLPRSFANTAFIQSPRRQA